MQEKLGANQSCHIAEDLCCCGFPGWITLTRAGISVFISCGNSKAVLLVVCRELKIIPFRFTEGSFLPPG